MSDTLYRYQFTFGPGVHTWLLTENMFTNLRTFYESFGIPMTDVVRTPTDYMEPQQPTLPSPENKETMAENVIEWMEHIRKFDNFQTGEA